MLHRLRLPAAPRHQPSPRIRRFGSAFFFKASRPVSSRVLDGLCVVGLASLLVLVGFILLNRPLKDDVAWLLYVAERMLDGRRLYVDLVEINPPLIVWLSALPAGAARGLGLPAIPVFLAAVAVALLGCAWATAGLLRGYGALFRYRLRVFTVIAGVLFVIPGLEFGQREHILVAFVLPYLAVLVLRLRGRELVPDVAAAFGILAGIGFALKPHHLITFGLLEAWALAQGLGPPWRRAEAVGAGLFLVLYGLSVAWFYPAYLTEVVPLVRALYGASNAELVSLLAQGRYLLIPLAIIALLVLAGIGRLGREPLVQVLAVFVAGALLAYLAQRKGWLYHRLPAGIAMVLLLVYWVVQTVHDAGERASRAAWASFGAFAGLLGVLVAAALDRLGHDMAVALHPEMTIEHRLAELIRSDGAESLMVFSQDLSPAFPVVNMTGVRWTSRFATVWPLRGELWRQACCLDPAAPPGPPLPVRRWIVDDFLAGRPDMVVVDDRQGIDYIGELAADPRFAAAWSPYRLRTTLDGRRVFELGSPRALSFGDATAPGS
jgi:hypothetical protein